MCRVQCVHFRIEPLLPDVGTKGLRTLLTAKAKKTEKEYQQWLKIFKEAEVSMQSREEKVKTMRWRDSKTCATRVACCRSELVSADFGLRFTPPSPAAVSFLWTKHVPVQVYHPSGDYDCLRILFFKSLEFHNKPFYHVCPRSSTAAPSTSNT